MTVAQFTSAPQSVKQPMGLHKDFKNIHVGHGGKKNFN